MIATTKQISEVFGVTQQAISLWSEKGCPKVGHGKWDIREVFNWWLENIYKEENDTEEMAAAKLEYWQAKARSEKVKADVAEDKAILVDDFKQSWVWRVSEMSNGLGSIPLRLAPLIAGKHESDIRSILENEIWKIRDKFARTGKFTPQPEPKKRSTPRRVKK